MTKPVTHPAKGILAVQRLTLREVAEQIGMNSQVVGRMLNGRAAASPRFRRDLSRVLDRPESELFVAEPRPETLQAPASHGGGRRGAVAR